MSELQSRSLNSGYSLTHQFGNLGCCYREALFWLALPVSLMNSLSG